MSNARPVLSSAAYVGPFGRITGSLDPYTEADRAGVLAHLLVAFSAYVGPSTQVVHGKTQPVALWVAAIGRTGVGRKGTSASVALDLVRAAWAGWMETSLVEGCPATGLGLIQELSERADGIEAQPVLIIEEEGDQLVSSARRDPKVGIMLRKSWDASTLRHKTKVDDITVRRPHMGFVLHVQPRNWAAISGGRDASGGTWNRMLACFVEREKRVRLSQARTPSEVLIPLARELRTIGEYARNVPEVTMPEHVEDVFETRHRPVVESLTLGSEEMAQMTERSLAYLLRLSALYALSEGRDEISVRDLDAGLALVEYSVATIEHVLPKAEISHDSLPVRVEAHVREAGPEGVRSTEIYRKYGITKADLDTIVAGLGTMDVSQGVSTGGRKPVIVRYVPLAEEVFETEDMASDSTEEVSGSAEEGTEGIVSEIFGQIAEPSRPEELAALEEAMYGPAKPEPIEVTVPLGVDAFRALLDGANAPAEETTQEPDNDPEPSDPAPALPMGVETLRAVLVDAESTPQEETVPVQETLNDELQEDEEDDDLSDLLANCPWANVKVA